MLFFIWKRLDLSRKYVNRFIHVKFLSRLIPFMTYPPLLPSDQASFAGQSGTVPLIYFPSFPFLSRPPFDDFVFLAGHIDFMFTHWISPPFGWKKRLLLFEKVFSGIYQYVENLDLLDGNSSEDSRRSMKIYPEFEKY